jgi:hypothetical protein
VSGGGGGVREERMEALRLQLAEDTVVGVEIVVNRVTTRKLVYYRQVQVENGGVSYS